MTIESFMGNERDPTHSGNIKRYQGTEDTMCAEYISHDTPFISAYVNVQREGETG